MENEKRRLEEQLKRALLDLEDRSRTADDLEKERDFLRNQLESTNQEKSSVEKAKLVI